MDVKTAIETGEAKALQQLLAGDPALANQLIVWGNCQTHPLHFISDKLFDGTLERGKELPLVEALLAAGSDVNHQAPNGETPLIGAASLGAEAVGLRLLEAGARVNATSIFDSTALHWAALLGLDRLAGQLIQQGSNIHLKDSRYHSTPLGWAVHGRYHAPAGNRGHQCEVAAKLVAAGAELDRNWLADPKIQGDTALFTALTGRS